MLASGGSRIEWRDIPEAVRAGVEDQLGAMVIEARNQSGGFSPGMAARCRLSDGDRVFIKAVSPAQNPMATRIHRREAEVAGALPDTVAAARLRDVFDDGTWIVLVFDDIEGRQPTEPWTQDGPRHRAPRGPGVQHLRDAGSGRRVAVGPGPPPRRVQRVAASRLRRWRHRAHRPLGS